MKRFILPEPETLLIWPGFLIVVLINFAFPNPTVKMLSNDERGVVFELRLDHYDLKEMNEGKKKYHKLYFQGCSYPDLPGVPQIPAYDIQLVVPRGVVSPQIELLDFESSQIGNVHLLPFSKGYSHDYSKLKEKNFPEHLVQVTQSGVIRSQRVVNVKIYPFKYSATSGQLKYYSYLKVQVLFMYTGTEFRSINLSKAKRMVGRDPLLNSLVLNKGFNGDLPYLKKVTVSENLNYSQGIKILIKEDGIYKIGYDYLKRQGISPERITDLRKLKLYNQGEEGPLYVADSNNNFKFDLEDYLQFYGKHLFGPETYFSQYSEENVYFLFWEGNSNGKRVVIQNVEPILGATIPRENDFLRTIHLEKDVEYGFFKDIDLDQFVFEDITGSALLPSEEIPDNWYWETMTGKPNGASGADVKFNLPAIKNNQNKKINIKINLRGYTSDQHEIEFQLNNIKLDTLFFTGQSETTFTIRNIEKEDILKSGENILELNFLTSAIKKEGVVFNWMELDYWGEYRALEDELYFQNTVMNGWFEIKINGFKSPQIELWDLAGRKLSGFLVNRDVLDNSYSIRFQEDPFRINQYYAYSNDKIMAPQGVEFYRSSNLNSSSQQADYIAIVNRSKLYSAIDSLLVDSLIQQRKKQGLVTKVVFVEDLYNDFNHGIQEPQAIKNFIQYAFENWRSPKVQYVLLIGDATYYNGKGNYFQDRNLIPVYRSQIPHWGKAAHDGWYGTVSGEDNFQDVIIGRLPVNNTVELRSVIQKILAYENKQDLNFSDFSFFMIGGEEKEFISHHDHLANDYVRKDFISKFVDACSAFVDERNRIYLSPYFYGSQNRSRLLATINEGAGIINFSGHGGGSVWSDQGLFLIDDVTKLSNFRKYPIVFSMTCLTGFFESLDFPCLSERMLREPNKGSVAFYAASGYVSRSGDFRMNDEMFYALLEEGERTLGNLIFKMETRIQMKYDGYENNVLEYNLLGDPAMPIRLPDKDQLKIQLDKNIFVPHIDTMIQAVVNVAAFPSAKSYHYQISDWADSIIFDSISGVLPTMDSLKFKWVAPAPEKLSDQRGIVRLALWNDSLLSSGVNYFSVNPFILKAVKVLPAMPGYGDSLWLEVEILGGSGKNVESVVAYFGTKLILFTANRETNYQYGIPTIGNQSIGYPMVIKDSILSKNIWKTSSAFVLNLNLNKDTRDSMLVLHFRINGEATPSLYYSVPLNEKINLVPAQIGVSRGSHIKNIVYNKGMGAANGFDVEMVVTKDSLLNPNNFSSAETLIISYSKSLVSGDYDTIVFIIPDSMGYFGYRLDVDPGNRLNQSDFNDDIKTGIFEINWKTFSPQSGGVHWSLDSTVYIETKNNVYSVPFRLDLISAHLDTLNWQSTRQPDLKWGSHRQDSIRLYQIRFADSVFEAAQFDSFMTISINYEKYDTLIGRGISNYFMPDSNSSVGKTGVFVYNLEQRVWVYQPSVIDTSKKIISAEVKQFPFFAVLRSLDLESPEISIYSKDFGLEIINYSYIPQRPQFQINLTDENGIDTSRVALSIGENRVNREEVQIKPQNLGTTYLFYQPDLSGKIGQEDSLRIVVYDNSGNLSQKVIRFKVGGDFKIETLANHPNPFYGDRETIIAYTLTDLAINATIRIYTIAGRLVKLFELGPRLGYNEEVWDGRDDDGQAVPIGVYYMKFTAETSERRISRVEKIVKIEN